MTGPALTVVRAGALTTAQDPGRAGSAHLGVPRSGALDLPAHLLANRLVGNAPGAATLETTLDGCAVRAHRAVTAAVTGAPSAVTSDGRPAPGGAAVRGPAGAVFAAGPAVRGVRAYLAFAGGVAVEPVLGSRATDLLSGLGPEPLADGTVLPLGKPAAPPPPLDVAPQPAPPRELVLRLRLGPRDDWFTDAAPRTLATGRYRVSSAGNRVGLRTEGPALVRSREGELPSEGMVLGAVQVPPDGRPVVFLADHPTTGGYPVVGVVPAADLAAAAQAAPGTPLRFVPLRRVAPRAGQVPGGGSSVPSGPRSRLSSSGVRS
ncbi:5-oxoprolinase subunit C family protein [Streptomyces specialis]|uniref:5-oxoprolinase subunit C family protein n=1 Tax=Streptomyces specialis TaxID=498367 RepID=UPI00099EB212|nr:biotin-dependent carboxyltransferase family protein [Streptomyces specialis]